jgi:hypothetical protein
MGRNGITSARILYELDSLADGTTGRFGVKFFHWNIVLSAEGSAVTDRRYNYSFAADV